MNIYYLDFESKKYVRGDYPWSLYLIQQIISFPCRITFRLHFHYFCHSNLSSVPIYLFYLYVKFKHMQEAYSRITYMQNIYIYKSLKFFGWICTWQYIKIRTSGKQNSTNLLLSSGIFCINKPDNITPVTAFDFHWWTS